MKKYIARTLFSPNTPQARLNPLIPHRRLLSSESSSTGSDTSSSFLSGTWDANNRIRVAGSVLALATGAGLLFDTVYRRATKQELQEVEKKLEMKIDRVEKKINAQIDRTNDKIDRVEKEINAQIEKTNDKIDHVEKGINAKIDSKIDALNSKIDGLTHALLHTHQRDRILAEEENRELRRELHVSGPKC